MKLVKSILFAILIVLSLAACSDTGYKDGVYEAQAPEFDAHGWKEILELTIDKGKITKINWDAIYVDDSIPIRKKQYSKSGLYGMIAGGSIAEWYDQAVAAEQFVLENGVDSLVVNDDGYTDVVASCTIGVSEFQKLLKECLVQAKK